MTETMAVEHSCSSAQFVHCPIHQPGRPKTKRCPNCGAGWVTHDGLYAVITWRGDGRYRLADALATYKRLDVAQRRAETEGESFVVRFLSH